MVEPSNRMVGQITSETLLTPAINSWEYYLNDQGKSPHTVKAFMSDIRLLIEYLPPDQTLESITTNDLNNFFDWLEKGRNVPCSPKTLARRITSLKAFFRWLSNAAVIPINPMDKIPQRSVISPLPEVLTDEEVTAVLNTANQHRWDSKRDARPYTLVSLLLGTGIKKSECLGIHLNHLDLEAPKGPLVFIRYASPSNRYKERKITLPEDWLDAFNEYTAQYEPVDQLFPWSPRRLEYLLEDIGNEANLSKHLSFDMCRWTSSLIDISNNVEPDKIRQKLGISKIQWREISNKLEQLSPPGALE
ncbi:MAG TPA: site-specific integrase [Anaerolineales bacterium]|nr:site-specific integrase [Anaerolineales bacterium]